MKINEQNLDLSKQGKTAVAKQNAQALTVVRIAGDDGIGIESLMSYYRWSEHYSRSVLGRLVKSGQVSKVGNRYFYNEVLVAQDVPVSVVSPSGKTTLIGSLNNLMVKLGLKRV